MSLDNVNKTLYIPLYGKALVSRQGVILKDITAERIWEEGAVPLGKKSKSRWLAYFMSMRARTFDDWVRKMLAICQNATVLHIGCGLDRRILRVGASGVLWYDLDFPEVIAMRKKHYSESEFYHMISGSAAQPDWLSRIPKDRTAVIVMEGVSMYLSLDALRRLLLALSEHFASFHLMTDVYTELGAKLSRWKNPISDVGVTAVYGLRHPKEPLGKSRVSYVQEHSMTPSDLVNQLTGFDRRFFKLMFAGNAARKLYRMYEYER